MQTDNKTETASNPLLGTSSLTSKISSCLLSIKDLKKLDCTTYSRVAVDAEWVKKRLKENFPESLYLTKQFTFLDNDLNPVLTVVLWNADYPSPTKLLVVDHPVVVITCDVNNTVLKDVCLLSKKLLCYMYYSPKDIQAMVGASVWRTVLLDDDRPIRKLRNITGKFVLDETEYVLKDCFGAFNQSLDKAMISVGVDNPYKNNVDKLNQDKSQMDLFMRDHPNEFLEYAFGDTAYLGETLQNRVEQVNKIIREALGDVVQFDVDNFPMSSGSLVAKTFEAWLISDYPDLMQQVLRFSDANDNKHWSDLKKLKAFLNESSDPVRVSAVSDKMRSSNYVHGLSMGSIRNYALLSRNTGLFGAMVMGGRCINEEPHTNPFENRIKNVVDIDLSSCYGSALSKFDYPLGIPTIYENAIDDKPLNLKSFLNKYGKDLVPGLYTIVVKGNLPFEQDLIHSKYELSTAKIQRTILSENFEQTTDDLYGREIETAHIGGNFLLTKKQIENGIITADILEIINNTADNRELKSFMDLEVVAAIYYPKSLEKTNQEWVNMPVGGKYAKGDLRTRCWTRIPLSNFIDKFISYRKTAKRKIQEKGDKNDLLQNGVKLFINTTYGDFAAPYFPMGNTVLANNITAKARAGVWMLSKALLTVQSITDGGMFSSDRVATITGKKPGFNTLACRERFLKHRGIKTVKLTDRYIWQWMKDALENNDSASKKELDRLCLDHINDFWSNYNLQLPFDIECKYENTAVEAIYFGSSDYLLSNTAKGKLEEIKCRGAKEKDHPKQQWLRHLLNPDKHPLPNPSFTYTQLIGVNEFLENRKEPAFNYLLPGDEMERTTWHRPYTNGEVYSDYSEYFKVKKAKTEAIRRQEKMIATEADQEKLYFHLAKQIKEKKHPYSTN